MTPQQQPGAGARPIDLGREPDFAVGGLTVHPSLCDVEARGRHETVQPKAMQVFVALVRTGGGVVSRDQLIGMCWDGRAIGDDAINRAIAKVRDIAGLSDPPAFEIETIPRVGFRLKASPTTPGLPGLPAVDASQRPEKQGQRWGIRGLSVVVLAFVLLAIGAYAINLSTHPAVDVGGPFPPDEASIAVLPFLNMSGDPGKEYFSDGFSEELLNDLANTPQLRVAARTSSFAFKERPANVQEIAGKLHVRTVLEGSVREAGNRVRITAQLIDSLSGYHLWSQTYDRELTDILKVQDEIARAIADALSKKLITRLKQGPSAIDPEAYRKYLLGKFYFDHHVEADNDRAIALFKDVTTLQPDFPDGYAMLGYASLARFDSGRADHDMVAAVTRAALDRALTLDPRNLTALIACMDLALWQQNWDAAAQWVERMRRVNPNNATVARASGLYYQFLGFPEQSRQAFIRATKLDPLSHVTWGSLAIMDANVGRNDEAIAAGNTALALSPGSVGVLAWVCVAHATEGDFDEARRLAAKLEQTPDGRRLKGCEQEIARVGGDRQTARRLVEERVRNNQGDPSFLGQSYLLVGEYGKALPLLHRAYEVGDLSLYTLPLDPVTPRDFLRSAAWKELTQRPRFRAWQAAHDRLARQLGLPGKG